MIYECKVKGYRDTKEGTELKILLPKNSISSEIIKQNATNGELRLDDGRSISAEQRKKAYATINDIAVQTGHYQEFLKEYFKYQLMVEKNIEYFSLSNCTMTTAREYINLIIEFCLKFRIQLTDKGLNRTDDIDRYLYSCLKNRVCCLCGIDADIHHWDTVGANGGRKHDDSKLRKISLCRKHHTEIHRVGRDTFEEKYHVYGILFNE